MLERVARGGLAEKVTSEVGDGSQASQFCPLSPGSTLGTARPWGKLTPTHSFQALWLYLTLRVFASHYFIYLFILLIPLVCNGKETNSF